MKKDIKLVFEDSKILDVFIDTLWHRHGRTAADRNCASCRE